MGTEARKIRFNVSRICIYTNFPTRLPPTRAYPSTYTHAHIHPRAHTHTLLHSHILSRHSQTRSHVCCMQHTCRTRTYTHTYTHTHIHTHTYYRALAEARLSTAREAISRSISSSRSLCTVTTRERSGKFYSVKAKYEGGEEEVGCLIYSIIL